MTASIQDLFAPNLKCFGCGPANPQGLRIKSHPRTDGVEGLTAVFAPEAFMEAFPRVLSGGIVGTILDCHANWTAAWHLMRKLHASTPPCSVTARFTVDLLAPTPTQAPLRITSRVVNATDRKVEVEAVLSPAAGEPVAKLVGLFLSVKEGHPAFHRW